MLWAQLLCPSPIVSRRLENVSSPLSPAPTHPEYMRLPVSSYSVLDATMIRALDANDAGQGFVLSVPRLQILQVWCEPEIVIKAGVVEDGGPGGAPVVRLTADRCRLPGSAAWESLGLDRRFRLELNVDLSWDATTAAPAPAPSSEALTADILAGEISAHVRVDVWCEVVPPFHVVPRTTLVWTVQQAIKVVMSLTLPAFLRGLGRDHDKWAVDPEYRASRGGYTD